MSVALLLAQCCQQDDSAAYADICIYKVGEQTARNAFECPVSGDYSYHQSSQSVQYVLDQLFLVQGEVKPQST